MTKRGVIRYDVCWQQTSIDKNKNDFSRWEIEPKWFALSSFHVYKNSRNPFKQKNWGQGWIRKKKKKTNCWFLCNWFFCRDNNDCFIYLSLASSKSSRSRLSVSYSPWTLHRVFPPISTPIVVVSDIRFALAGQYRIWTRLYLLLANTSGRKTTNKQQKRKDLGQLKWQRSTTRIADVKNPHNPAGIRDSKESPWSPKFE